MRPLDSIYSHRVLEFMKTQVGFNPIQKRNSNPQRKVQSRLSVDRPVDRPMPRSTGPVDRAYPRARPLQSVDRGRSTAPSCACPCTPVDRAGRPASSTGRPASSTGRPDHRPGVQIACSMRRSLFLCRPISVLSSSISFISSISSLPHEAQLEKQSTFPSSLCITVV